MLILVLLLGTALLITTVGWMRATESIQLGEDAPARFDGCTFDGNTLVLRYSYGANQMVAPSVDTRQQDKIVVKLDTEVGDGMTVAIGLAGRAKFLVYGADGDTTIEYTDGKRLTCDEPRAS